MQRLKGWQLTGIILSILWAIGARIHARDSNLQGANGFADLSYKVCTNEKLLASDNELFKLRSGAAKEY